MQRICFRLKIHSSGLPQNNLCPARDSRLPQESNYVVGPLGHCMEPEKGLGPGAIKYLVCSSLLYSPCSGRLWSQSVGFLFLFSFFFPL